MQLRIWLIVVLITVKDCFVLKFQGSLDRKGAPSFLELSTHETVLHAYDGGHMSSFHHSSPTNLCDKKVLELRKDRPGGALFILSCKLVRFFGKCN